MLYSFLSIQGLMFLLVATQCVISLLPTIRGVCFLFITRMPLDEKIKRMPAWEIYLILVSMVLNVLWMHFRRKSISVLPCRESKLCIFSRFFLCWEINHTKNSLYIPAFYVIYYMGSSCLNFPQTTYAWTVTFLLWLVPG